MLLGQDGVSVGHFVSRLRFLYYFDSIFVFVGLGIQDDELCLTLFDYELLARLRFGRLGFTFTQFPH